jgi:hypothetical protein
MMEWLAVVLVGLLAGTHTATWGMYKDAPHEGFRRYPRSMLVSTAVAPVAYWLIGLDASRAADLVILWGVVYVAERGITEFYKVYWRSEDQSKYFIPMQFHVFGRVIHSRVQRLKVGIPHAAVVIGLLFAIDWIQDTSSLPLWLLAVTVGSLGGWISAFGGAWKDAPIEGFEWFKFFRSPVVAGLYALLLTTFTSDLVVIALAAEGFTVATLETYKTFFFPSKPRGKFAGKPILFPNMLRVRQRFLLLYIFIWLTVIGGFITAFVRGEALGA